MLGGEWMENSCVEKDLGMLVGDKLERAGTVQLQPRKRSVSWAASNAV